MGRICCQNLGMRKLRCFRNCSKSIERRIEGNAAFLCSREMCIWAWVWGGTCAGRLCSLRSSIPNLHSVPRTALHFLWWPNSWVSECGRRGYRQARTVHCSEWGQLAMDLMRLKLTSHWPQQRLQRWSYECYACPANAVSSLHNPQPRTSDCSSQIPGRNVRVNSAILLGSL